MLRAVHHHIGVVHPTDHPFEEDLERFAMRRLPVEMTLQISLHCAHCESCRARLLSESEFTETIREALSSDTTPGASLRPPESPPAGK